MPLFTYTYWNYFRRQYVTLDCFGADRKAAMKSACRWINRENRRLKRLSIPKRFQLPPGPEHLKLEGPATNPEKPAEGEAATPA